MKLVERLETETLRRGRRYDSLSVKQNPFKMKIKV